MNIIEVNNLKKCFYGKRKSGVVEAVKGISLFVKQGEIFGFLGPNGAGKTTSMRMFTTLLPFEEGEVRVGEFDVKRYPQEVRKHIGYVGQLGGADLEATGYENLMLSGRLYGMSPKIIETQIRNLTELLGLQQIIHRFAKTYSGGERRRLELAIGIMHKPSVLFLDEPTIGLDPQNRNTLWTYIRQLRKEGMTIFLTTHYLEEADALCDRLCIMDKGMIVAEGTPKQLKAEISGDVILIKLKNIEDDIQNIFAEDSNVLGIESGEEVIKLYVQDGVYALSQIFYKLKERGIDLESISLSQPTLDDVFLRKTGKSMETIGKEIRT